MAELVFNVVEGTLRGTFSGKTVDCYAVSGGRGGSTLSNVGNKLLQNNWLSSQVNLKDAGIGGTLPLGRYAMTPHEKKLKWVRLTPLEGTYMGNRAGMAIHGRGARGSDGCIVPLQIGEAQKIRQMVEKYIIANKSNPTLDVVAIGSTDFNFSLA